MFKDNVHSPDTGFIVGTVKKPWYHHRKIIFIIVIAIAIIVSLLIAIYFVSDHRTLSQQELQALIKEEEKLYPLGYTKPNLLKQLFTVEGEVVSITPDSLSINVDGEPKVFRIIDNTEFYIGVDYLESNISSVKPGGKVQVTYNKSTNEIKSVWGGL